MNHVASTQAHSYRPTSDVAALAAAQFAPRMSEWEDKHSAASTALFAFVSEKTGQTPRGTLASDCLDMTIYGLVFDKAPADGFIAVPSHIADGLHAQGIRGAGYFPDVNTELGAKVKQYMAALSRVNEERPGMNALPGVSWAAVQDKTLVLTRVEATEAGYVIHAAPNAVRPDAELEMIVAQASTKLVEEASKRAVAAPAFRM